jgi:cell division protease FtsH
MTEKELQTKMIILFGGRAAEYVILDVLSTGAADDMIKATDIARNMIMQYGMHHKMGSVSYGVNHSSYLSIFSDTPNKRNFSEATAKEIDDAIHEIVQHAFDQAINIIKSHRQQMEKGAKLLLEKETLEGRDMEIL